MKKLFKWLLGIFGFLVVLLVIAIIVLPLVFDPNDHKPQIQKMAAENMGREVVLNGPIEWSVFPWLAINLNDVTIANESGFKGEYLAQVEQVAVRVKLLPLLRKQIQVGQVELKQPNIKLQVSQSGKSNWQSISDHLESEPGSSSTESSTTDLEIRGISVTGGQLTYTDGGADLQVQMNDLSFFSEAIKPNTPTKMSINAEINMAAQELSGQLKANWVMQGLTDESGMKLVFDQLEFNGMSSALPLELSSEGEMVIDLGQDSLNINQLQLSYGVMTLTTPMMGENITQNMALSGQLKLNEFALDDLLASMGSPLDNQAQNNLSGQMQWSLVDDRLQLQDIDVQLDGSKVTGDVDIKQLSALKGEFNLKVNDLNLDQYLPSAEESSAASTGTSAAMDMGQMSGQIKMDSLQAAGVKLSDITLKIRTQGTNLTVEPLQAGFYQGLIKTELRLQPEKATEKLQLTHRMQDFQAGGLLTDLMGTDYLTGLGQLNADIKIDQPFSERPLQSANGTISYQLSDGDIVGIDVFQIMQKSLSLLNKTEASKTNEELKTAFGLMDIQANISNGVLKTNKLRLTSPYFDLKGDVEINLDQQTIKGSIKPMLTNIPEDLLDNNLAKLVNIRIPVSLSGNLLEPSISIDVAQLILESQKAKIDEKKEELKEDLFDALLGNKKDKKKQQDGATEGTDPNSDQPEMTEKQKKRAEKDQRKKDLLEGLFKSVTDKEKKQDNQDDPDTDGDGN